MVVVFFYYVFLELVNLCIAFHVNIFGLRQVSFISLVRGLVLR